ncbi:hypothetical protein, partial [Salmonella sp. s51228]|uniref:hypothetical protein n=1 Tax=Salmonella sp. s51228 TaxID=3159652 RepID=UPI0039808BCA
KIKPSLNLNCGNLITSVWIEEDLLSYISRNSDLFNPSIYLLDPLQSLNFTRTININSTRQTNLSYDDLSTVTLKVIRYCVGRFLKVYKYRFRIPFIAPAIPGALVVSTASKETVLLQAHNHYFCNSYAYEFDAKRNLEISLKLEFINRFSSTITTPYSLDKHEIDS